MDIIRDSAFGQLVRLLSGKRWFKYPEEQNPELWKKYLHEQKSGYMAHHGTLEPHDKDSVLEGMEGLRGLRTREAADGSIPITAEDASPRSASSSNLEKPDTTVNLASGAKVDPERGRDVHVIDWYGDKDPQNPQNWGLTKKVFVTFQICLLTTAIYIGSAIYSAGIVGVSEEFGVSSVAATLGLTLFVAGYGLGPMIWSPMSEIPQIGRNPIYIGTLIVFVALQVPVALASNFGMLLAFRFITGFVGSPVLATGGASVADIWSPKKRAYAMSIWGVSAVCGPTLGPVVGGFAAQYETWRWTIWELLWLSGGALAFLFFFFPETSANNILYRRTARLRKYSGNDKLICEPEIMGENMTPREIALMVLVRPFTLNFWEPMVFLLNLYIALIYGLLYIWFESFPIVFIEIYGFSLSMQGLAFLGILIGALAVIPPFFAYLYYFQEPQFNENGDIKPEKRLPPACVGGFAVVICLFWFGWSAGRTHWIMPIIGSAWFSVGAFLLFNSVLNYLPDAYPTYAASVLAGNDLMRSSFGAGFPLFATAMYNKLGVDWASSLLGFLGIAFIPIPFVLYFVGERLRKNNSHYARKDI